MRVFPSNCPAHTSVLLQCTPHDPDPTAMRSCLHLATFVLTLSSMYAGRVVASESVPFATSYVETLPGCGGVDYAVRGRVVDKDGRPVPAAIIGVSWIEGESPAGPALTVTDTTGRYSLAFHYSTSWTLSGFAAMCPPSQPDQVSIAARADGGYSEPVVVKVTGTTIDAPPVIVAEAADAP